MWSIKVLLLLKSTKTKHECYYSKNPLGHKSDQHKLSPNNISRSTRVKVMRIT